FRNQENAQIEPLDSVCGLAATLRAVDRTTTGGWSSNPADGVGFSEPSDPITRVTVPEPGLYTFTWTVGSGGCEGIGSLTVYFAPPILDNFDALDTVVILAGESVQLNADIGIPGLRYTWTPSSGLNDPNIPNPVASPLETTIYTVRISSGVNGLPCNATGQVLVQVVSDIIIPNVFTPNGDLVNDTWRIPLLETLDNVNVRIFTRWGDLVFESSGLYVPWDGTFKGKPVSTATYYYKINIRGGRTLGGSVTVVR
ncbi:MAG: gliding motility-associated C-terminal domain-containing protein, partial [Bacteroidia bacterium]|nr:gliding motility-associated C-terminal domain-containing protein [Bacteroidia bacterium]